MFIEFFYYLKERLPISITEYMTLLQALDKGLIHNMVEFYYCSRSILCKSEAYFDLFDIAFANFFKNAMVNFPEDIKQEIWDWLNKEITFQELLIGLQLMLNQYGQFLIVEDLKKFLEELLKNEGIELDGKLLISDPSQITDEVMEWLKKNVIPEELANSFKQLIEGNFDLEALQNQFEELLRKQDEEHNFGHHMIGTQGDSRFGHSGQNPMGLKLGGAAGMRMAIQIAQKRIFQDYRKDIVLDTRQIKVALKRLKKLEEIGKQDELDMDQTIDKTAKNGGDIEIIFDKRRKNNVKLILLMDVGGSMTPYAHLVNLLFSAANNMSHWKDFKYYYFHNCIYNYLYENAARNTDEAIEFEDFLKKYDDSYRVIIVGDQTMHRSELVTPHGAIYDDASNKKPGLYYINEIAKHFKKNVIWLNPEPVRDDWMTWTKMKIAQIIPTFHLTIGGIENAMDYLRTGGKNHYTTVDILKDVPLALF